MSKMNLLVLGMVLFLAVTVSADVAFVGTVYDGAAGSGNGMSGASVSVVCGGNSATDVSESDGTYAILFGESECNESVDWSISVSKSGYNSFNGGSKAVDYSGMVDLSVIYSAVVDFVLTKESGSSGGGSSGGNNGRGCKVEFWDCNSSLWGECVDGFQTRTCASNCATKKIENRSCVAVEDLGTSEFVEDDVAEEDEEDGFLSTITGAAIGGGRTTWAIGGLFVVLVVGGIVFVISKRKK